MRTILVCGGRDFADADAFRLAMRTVVKSVSGEELRVVQGGASGADALARRWADEHHYECVTYEADWRGEGRAAGPKRNQRMLDGEHVSLVVAFPGGRGTADMVRRAKAKGIQVWLPPLDKEPKP